jgi:hypothetical protein
VPLWIVIGISIAGVLCIIGTAMVRDANKSLIWLRWDWDYSHGRKFWFQFPDPPAPFLYSENYTDAMLYWIISMVTLGSGGIVFVLIIPYLFPEIFF